MFAAGTRAPDFILPDQNGKMHSLSDYAGKKDILYFYPKDRSVGCTKQACAFGELYPQFVEKRGCHHRCEQGFGGVPQEI